MVRTADNLCVKNRGNGSSPDFLDSPCRSYPGHPSFGFSNDERGEYMPAAEATDIRQSTRRRACRLSPLLGLSLLPCGSPRRQATDQLAASSPLWPG